MPGFSVINSVTHHQTFQYENTMVFLLLLILQIKCTNNASASFFNLLLLIHKWILLATVNRPGKHFLRNQGWRRMIWIWEYFYIFLLLILGVDKGLPINVAYVPSHLYHICFELLKVNCYDVDSILRVRVVYWISIQPEFLWKPSISSIAIYVCQVKAALKK